jgi:hypothetical protein
MLEGIRLGARPFLLLSALHTLITAFRSPRPPRPQKPHKPRSVSLSTQRTDAVVSHRVLENFCPPPVPSPVSFLWQKSAHPFPLPSLPYGNGHRTSRNAFGQAQGLFQVSYTHCRFMIYCILDCLTIIIPRHHSLPYEFEGIKA